jgi:hypothetical protein
MAQRRHAGCTIRLTMRLARLLRMLVPVTSLALAAGCGSGDGEGGSPPPNTEREEGQTDFSSAPPVGQGGGAGRGFGGGGATGAESSNAAPAPAADGAQQTGGAGGAKPEIKETDLYRVEGDRLYYLNSYRGLMVFDITNVDDPKLLGRSPVFGTPVEMYVNAGIATVVVGDWYGTAKDGSPFHGSVVRTINAQDPANITIAGEVQVKGWARDMRVVGSNLYIVGEDYGWMYGYWYGGYYGGGDVAVGGANCYGCGGYNSKVVISSVALGGNAPVLAGEKVYDGYSGAFNVTESTIILAHDVVDPSTKQPTGKASLEWINITNPSGAIEPKGSFEVDGLLQGWSADNGRWNVNLEGNTAEVITCAASQYNYCNGNEGYNLTTVDFTDPNAPKLQGKLAIPGKGWAATARFHNNRMYLSPREGYYSSGTQQPTPVEVYDLTDKASPKLAGSTTINGAVWLFMPMGTDRLFALGNEYGQSGSGYYSSSQVSVRYLDVADAANPKLIGTSSFGSDWAWTPAAGTFKAFVRDDGQKLVALPFSGWNYNSYEYTNGVQLIEYDTNAITTRGASKSQGWVERGIFVKNRVISLSDQSLTVVDHSDRNAPKVVREITLARNVVAAQPDGNTIAQLSTDWWGYDNSKSELRVLPIANAEETKFDPAAKSVSIDGTNARIFRNGDLAYVITTLYPKNPNGGAYYATPRVQVVDLSNGGAVLRGSVELPQEQGYWWSWWGGCYYWDWYDGSNAVQVGKDVLAFRRVHGSYDPNTGKYEAETKLYVIDLANADAPKLASTTITNDPDYWWGNVRVVGNTLYTTHYEWIQKPTPSSNGTTNWSSYWVKYYLDQIDLSDRNNPKVGKRINVPGILVGSDQNDDSLLYFVDYRWWGTQNKDELAVAKIVGDKAYLKSTTVLDGWVGNTIVRGSKAYLSSQEYFDPQNGQPGTASVKLNEIDLGDPKKPVVRTSAPKEGWGWLVDVEGDRAIITSGWGQVGLDIYKLQPNAAPTYDQFARTRGWWANAITRQNGDLFVSSGYWGVQKITLK